MRRVYCLLRVVFSRLPQEDSPQTGVSRNYCICCDKDWKGRLHWFGNIERKNDAVRVLFADLIIETLDFITTLDCYVLARVLTREIIISGTEWNASNALRVPLRREQVSL